MLDSWKQKVRQLKRETYALYLAYQDPRVPWTAKIVVMCIVGYALSPIDLIPDAIPILGQLDDLILIPVGIALAIRLIPADVLDACRERAAVELEQNRPTSRVAGVMIVLIWVVAIGLMFAFVGQAL